MSEAASLVATALLAFVLAERGVLLSIRVARHTGFYDTPGGYKAHGSATPYLGGAAVCLALLIAASAISGLFDRILVVVVCALALAAIGTVDDRLTVSPRWRVLAEVAAAVAVWAVHRGFTGLHSATLDLLITILWVLGIVNAFNLFDNLDGACATVAGVCAAGAGVFGLRYGEWHLTAVGLAIAGACAGFLRHNLRRPARIFLGDGGSMPLGFLIACLAMMVTREDGLGADQLLACGLLAGLPILDTTLVVISRKRRGISVMKGGRDHLTHRLLCRLGSPRRVAVALASGQAGLVGLAVLATGQGRAALTVLGLAAVAAGAGAIVLLERPGWAPAIAAGDGDPGGEFLALSGELRPAHPVAPAAAEEPVPDLAGAEQLAEQAELA
ncbi:MAG: glycosyltransferase family 4 protein [Solirubrobacteraceae bacterium]